MKDGTVNRLKWLSEDPVPFALSQFHLRRLKMKFYISGVFHSSLRVVDTLLSVGAGD